MRRLNRLSFEWKVHLHGNGTMLAELFVDGVVLLDQLERVAQHKLGDVSPFGWTMPEFQREIADQWLLRIPSSLPSGRQPLLVCNLCADLGCGVVSARIEMDGDLLIWSEIGSENFDDDDSLTLFRMGRFVFEREQVRHVLAGLVPDWKSA